MARFSRNSKLNAVLMDIYEDLQAMGLNEVERYRKEFPRETDYNLAQYGNLLIYYYDVRAMYERAGYKSLKGWSDTKIWELYKRQVGYVAEMMHSGKIK